VKYLLRVNGGISISRYFITLIITSSISALILIVAIESKGVFYKLTITKGFPLLATSSGIYAAGVTLRLDPNTRHRSAYSPHFYP